MTNSWLQVTQEALKIPGLLVEIYGDLARPGVRQAGKALETVIGLGNTILWPIAIANERSKIALEKNLERYRNNLASIPEEKIVGVAPEIGVPIAERLAYVLDDRLSELYAKLLATASNIDTVGNAHPSFVNVINNLSPDEANLLEYFVKRDALPFVNARAVIPSNGHYSDLDNLIIPSELTSSLVFPDNADAYISNLDGLGLLNIQNELPLSDQSIYELLEEQHSQRLNNLIQINPHFKDRQLQFKRGTIKRTSFGMKFIHACHAK